MIKFTHCFDMYDNPIYEEDILQNIDYGTQLKVVHNKDEKIFEGHYHPTEDKPCGCGVSNIKSLDFKKYFVIDMDTSNELKCRKCENHSELLFWRGYNCVGDGKFLACDEFELKDPKELI